MARVNVYVPDDLAEAARAARLNISAVTQEALGRALARRATDDWLARIPSSRAAVGHQQALRALDEARAEFGA
ncbi:MAG: type II toxin-antitoxin system CcdA family antitoxin [Angustibacter sp.]